MDNDFFSAAICGNKKFLDAYDEGIFWRGELDKNILKRAFSWAHLNQALATNRVTNDRFRLTHKNGHVALNRQAFQATKDSFGRPTDSLRMHELHSLMRDGATGIFESVHEIFPAVESVTNMLAARYYARSATNAYISFGVTSGFGVHNDDHDVLVFQIEGRKRWSFFGTSAQPFKAKACDLPFPVEKDVSEKLTLDEGDMLFIPKGTWHDVEAIGEASLHLTVSLVYPSCSEYIEWLLQQNQFGIPYRDIKLKNNIQLSDIAEHCGSFFGSNNSETSVADFLNAYYARYPSIRNRADFPALNVAHLEDSFQRIPFSFIDIANNDQCDDTFTISTLGKNVELNSLEYKLLSQMEVGTAYSGESLFELFGTDFHTWISLAIPMDSLLDKGLVSKCHHITGSNNRDQTTSRLCTQTPAE